MSSLSETSATPLSKLILAAYGWVPSLAGGGCLATGAAASVSRLDACTGAAAVVVTGEFSGEWSQASEAPASKRLPGTGAGAVAGGARAPLGEGALALSKRREGEEVEQAAEDDGKRAAEAAEEAEAEALSLVRVAVCEGKHRMVHLIRVGVGVGVGVGVTGCQGEAEAC